MAINPEAFAGSDIFKGLIDEMTGYMKTTPPAMGFDEVVLPGELDFRTYEKRLKEGIPVDEDVWQLIKQASQKVGVTIPELDETL